MLHNQQKVHRPFCGSVMLLWVAAKTVKAQTQPFLETRFAAAETQRVSC
jgi:hypothetical protein